MGTICSVEKILSATEPLPPEGVSQHLEGGFGDHLLGRAGAFNARNPVRLQDVLEQAAIIELDQELPKPLRVFLSEILLRWIHLYRLGQGETDQLRHVTFLEEVHNLFRLRSQQRRNRPAPQAEAELLGADSHHRRLNKSLQSS